MVTVWEGGSNYWMDVDSETRSIINLHWMDVRPDSLYKSIPFAERMTEYLWNGLTIDVVDAHDSYEILGNLTLDKINMALNHPDMADCSKSFLDGDFDIEITDLLLQWAVFNEIVYG